MSHHVLVELSSSHDSSFFHLLMFQEIECCSAAHSVLSSGKYFGWSVSSLREPATVPCLCFRGSYPFFMAGLIYVFKLCLLQLPANKAFPLSKKQLVRAKQSCLMPIYDRAFKMRHLPDAPCTPQMLKRKHIFFCCLMLIHFWSQHVRKSLSFCLASQNHFRPCTGISAPSPLGRHNDLPIMLSHYSSSPVLSTVKDRQIARLFPVYILNLPKKTTSSSLPFLSSLRCFFG